jgi:CHRD domain-containing protein
MKKITILHVLLIALTVLALASVAADGGRTFTTTLSGAAEVPPADPDGSGTATITLNYGQGTVCWEITVSNITLPATAAHIHEAPVGVAGPVVVPLSAPDASGSASGCATVDRAEIKDIIQHPEEYYVNVHNADYPGGAVRGQLSK